MVDEANLTLLYHACKLLAFKDMISLLVNDFKANINFMIPGYENNTILSVAIASNNEALVSFLFTFETLSVNNRHLHFSAAVGNEEIFSLIYQKVEARNTPNNSGQTPLMIAASMGKIYSFPNSRRGGYFANHQMVNQPAIFSTKESYLKCIKILVGMNFKLF